MIEKSISAVLCAYIFLLLVSTVLSRQINDNRMSILKPFWTYSVIARGGWKAMRLKQEIAFNILMMIPIGALCPVLFKEHTILKTLVTGLISTLLIEVLQYVTKRGYLEFDDIVHNTLGILIGFAFYKGIKSAKRFWSC